MGIRRGTLLRLQGPEGSQGHRVHGLWVLQRPRAEEAKGDCPRAPERAISGLQC